MSSRFKSLDLPPDVREKIMIDEQRGLKGCRVTITVDEPGFSDARVRLKFPYGEIETVTIGPGESFTYIQKPHLAHQTVVEGCRRAGDPEDPDLEGGAYE